tara:strand:+ start:2792 stop:2980 length:189 start_codon:yes stop_codon:yes gene_type:complete
METHVAIPIAAIIVSVAVIIGSLAPIITKKKDSVAEQLSEAVLREYGTDIDFTPDDEEDDED